MMGCVVFEVRVEWYGIKTVISVSASNDGRVEAQAGFN